MQPVKMILAALTMALTAAAARAAQAPVADAQVLKAAWQPHKVHMSYFGITSHYTCSGLEDHVRDILVHLGARRDAKVHASGCPGGPDQPSPTAWVDADFFTLATSEALPGAEVVKAYWSPRELGPRRPYFMGEGDCELIDQMKDTISSSFAFKDLEYRTDCVPHQISLDGYRVKGQALVELLPPKGTPAKP